MPVPLAVLSAFTGGIRAITAGGSGRSYIDPFGHRVRLSPRGVPYINRDLALIVQNPTGYRRLLSSLSQTQQAAGRIDELGEDIRDAVLAQEIRGIKTSLAAKQAPPDYTVPAVAVALLLGAWLMLR
jgi:hypothetical protein